MCSRKIVIFVTVLVLFSVAIVMQQINTRHITSTLAYDAISDYLGYTVIKKEKPKMSCIWQSDPEPFEPIKLPSCIQKWHDASKPRVRAETQLFLKEYLEKNEDKNCQGGRLQGIREPGDPFHQPWWGGLYFYYISMMLWQDFIFESKSCVRYLMIDEDATTLWPALLEDQQVHPPLRSPVFPVISSTLPHSPPFSPTLSYSYSLPSPLLSPSVTFCPLYSFSICIPSPF